LSNQTGQQGEKTERVGEKPALTEVLPRDSGVANKAKVFAGNRPKSRHRNRMAETFWLIHRFGESMHLCRSRPTRPTVGIRVNAKGKWTDRASVINRRPSRAHHEFAPGAGGS
jgi:hypothetical protein